MTSPLLVFDLDGTLVDSAPDLLATLDVILPKYGYDALPDPGLRDGIGHGARHLLQFALHRQQIAVEEAELDAMFADFLVYYEDHICDRTRPFPGLELLLDRLETAGWGFAVCTNKLEGLSRRLLEGLRIDNRFAAICGCDTFDTRKPDPAHLLNTITAAAGQPDQALMIGDSRTDLDTARNAAIPFIGVSFGYTPVPMAELGPDILIGSFDELTTDTAQALLKPATETVKRELLPL